MGASVARNERAWGRQSDGEAQAKPPRVNGLGAFRAFVQPYKAGTPFILVVTYLSSTASTARIVGR